MRQRKKLLSLLILALLFAPCQGAAGTAVAAEGEETVDAEPETLVGKGWWSNAQAGKDYVLHGDGSFVFEVNAVEGFTGTAATDGIAYEYNNFCAFSVEAYKDGWYIDVAPGGYAVSYPRAICRFTNARAIKPGRDARKIPGAKGA